MILRNTLVCALLFATTLRADTTWPFEPARDAFSADALFDLRSLNEPVAGQSGWVKVNADGDFVLGNGEPARFWAVGVDFPVGREHVQRPLWDQPESPDAAHTARWLSKRGVNMIRLHARINPRLPKDGPTPAITEADPEELAWIWGSLASAKQAGIYTTLSPYWANTMESRDGEWGTDWDGEHHALLFFEPKLQDAYKAWLRELFTTPAPELNGRTLAQEPALAIFQIQNEDSLLFWTFNKLKPGPRSRLGKAFGDWATKKHGSVENALSVWKLRHPDDRPAEGILGFINLWEFTRDAARKKVGSTPRHAATLEFLTTRMLAFNAEIARFVRDDLKCPVIVNAGNWKTADDVLLNDLERYSYSANEVSAANRYYGGVHQGKHNGWAIIAGDVFAGDSVTLNNPLGFPMNLKQTSGKAMIVSESAWVLPGPYAAEGPFLVAAYGSLTGVDTYYWFMHANEEWSQPQSANGYLPSQRKWTIGSPDCLGQFPASALMFRRGDVTRGKPVVVEHRPLTSLWAGDPPILSEISGFDPNRDATQARPGAATATQVDPFAFFVGPVAVVFDSNPSKTFVEPRLGEFIRHVSGGTVVRSNTGQLVLDTKSQTATVDTPLAQGATGHFAAGRTLDLSTLSLTCRNDFAGILAVSLDGKPLANSRKVLVQMGTTARPTNWKTEPATIKVEQVTIPGERIVNYGNAPWQVATAVCQITLRNPTLRSARALDANAMPVAETPLAHSADSVAFDFPAGSLYVVLEAIVPANRTP